MHRERGHRGRRDPGNPAGAPQARWARAREALLHLPRKSGDAREIETVRDQEALLTLQQATLLFVAAEMRGVGGLGFELHCHIGRQVEQPVALAPMQPKDAAAACVDHALTEARATDDIVAQTWLSSVEGFLETAPGEVTVQFAVGPRAGPAKGPLCRSEARLTCAVSGRDVKPITPVHMTGAPIAC